MEFKPPSLIPTLLATHVCLMLGTTGFALQHAKSPRHGQTLLFCNNTELKIFLPKFTTENNNLRLVFF